MRGEELRRWVQSIDLIDLIEAIVTSQMADTSAPRYRSMVVEFLRSAQFWAKRIGSMEPEKAPVSAAPRRSLNGVLSMWRTRAKREKNACAERRIWYTVCGKYRVVESKINHYPVRYYAERSEVGQWRIMGTHRTRKTAIARIDAVVRSGATMEV